MSSRSTLLACSFAAAAAGVCITAAPAAADGIDDYTPVNSADYLLSDPDRPGTAFFKTPDNRYCAIYWNTGYVGCDAVSMDAPPGTNQLRAATWEAAGFRFSDQPNFTHPDARVLPEGHRLTWDSATCGVGYQGTVTCAAGPHGFTLSAVYSVLH
ncbi:hypothetical protein ACFVMC_21575 [Nocardia sp. NPDC127579]|uniref:hypothetical protein n=1 Tax=Nocardia sp. NPDC127579 TaxID=3345402 RepID=UPI003634F90C